MTAQEPGTQRDYTRFVIVSAARTGSNMLASALNTSPHIVCFRELFNASSGVIGYHMEGYDDRSEADMELRDRDFVRFLDERIFVARPERAGAVGFKMPYEQLFWFPDVRAWLQEQRDIRVLHLRRRNMLRTMISLAIAKETGGWVDDVPLTLAQALTVRYAAKAARHPLRAAASIRRVLWPKARRNAAPAWKAARRQVSFTPDECRAYFTWSEQTGAEQDEAFRAHAILPVYFEDLVDERTRAFDKVQRFLGVPPERLFATTRQQNPEPLRDLIANYEELREAFAGTRYAPFLDAP